MSLTPLMPAYDDTHKLFILRKDGAVVSHPCGACVEWSIYAVCWRWNGCGEDDCREDVYLGSTNPCAVTKFIWTSTDLRNLLFDQTLTAPATGTAEIDFIFDGAVVKTVTVATTSGQPLTTPTGYGGPLSGEEGYFSFENNSMLNLASGWHSAEAYIVWKDAEGAVVSTTMHAACICVGVLPSGEDAFELKDVALLPGSGTPVCIDKDFAAFRILGPFRSYKDALFVRRYFSDLIDQWAGKCVCENGCMGREHIGGWSPPEWEPLPSGETIITEGVATFANQDWLGCLPLPYPLYVYFGWQVTEGPFDNVTFYLKFYDSNDGEVGEIEIGYEWLGRFTIPPCQRVEVVMYNSEDPVGYLSTAFNAQSSYAAFPLPEDPTDVLTENTCPEIFDGLDISDLVPFDATTLRDWLAENAETAGEWLGENPL